MFISASPSLYTLKSSISLFCDDVISKIFDPDRPSIMCWSLFCIYLILFLPISKITFELKKFIINENKIKSENDIIAIL